MRPVIIAFHSLLRSPAFSKGCGRSITSSMYSIRLGVSNERDNIIQDGKELRSRENNRELRTTELGFDASPVL